MGFGKGKGFTTKVVSEDITYTAKGSQTVVLTEETPTYVAEANTNSHVELTEENPTYETSVA